MSQGARQVGALVQTPVSWPVFDTDISSGVSFWISELKMGKKKRKYSTLKVILIFKAIEP